jgi:LEA14-like dessication related protein
VCFFVCFKQKYTNQRPFATFLCKVQKAIRNALIVSGILAGANYLFRLNKLGERLQYELIRISRNKSTSLSSSSITAEMRLINPTNTSLDINSLNGRIVYGGRVIGQMVSKKKFTISPGVSNLSLNFSIDNLGLLNSAIQNAMNKEPQTVRVEYILKTNFGSIPQSFSVNALDVA